MATNKDQIMYILVFVKKANVNYHQAARVDPLVPVPTAPTQTKKPPEGLSELLVDDMGQMTKRPMAQAELQQKGFIFLGGSL